MKGRKEESDIESRERGDQESERGERDTYKSLVREEQERVRERLGKERKRERERERERESEGNRRLKEKE